MTEEEAYAAGREAGIREAMEAVRETIVRYGHEPLEEAEATVAELLKSDKS